MNNIDPNSLILCYIGARGGSKRLPRKNLQLIGEETLIEHAIKMAVKSKYIDKLIFDSEDEEMLNHVKDIQRIRWINEERINISNFEIHKRHPALSEDDVSLYAPLKVVLEENPSYEIIVILQPDCPVKKPEDIDYCIEKFFEGIQRCKDEGTTFPFEDVMVFHNGMRTGTIRVISREAFLSVYPTSKIIAVDDREDFVEIHTEEDLLLANEMLHKKHDTFWVEAKIRRPVQYNTRMILNHFNRYITAIQRLGIKKSDNVIDASCGLGYGSYILSLHAGYVFGLDVNKEYLKKAEELYKNDNISFLNYDVFKNINHDVIDKIVFIETFEHIHQQNIFVFINMLLSHLKPDGDLFLTAPLGENKPSEYNLFHLNEPSLDVLYDLFEDEFKKTYIEIDTFKNSFDVDQKYCMITMQGYTGGKYVH